MTHILIVDDQEENIYYLKKLLEGHGYRVTSARHGAEALVYARKSPPDLVISDLLMPVMDGYTMLRHWKSDDKLKGIPFIVYTATYTESEDEQLAFDLGADAFILKPAEPESFLERIRSWEGANNINQKVPNVPTPSLNTNEHYNVTLIRKLEKKMLELEESHRLIQQERNDLLLLDRAIRSASQGIIVADATDPELPIIYVSPGFEAMTGYKASEILGKNCRFLQGPDTDPETVKNIRKKLLLGNGFSVEILNYHKNGRSFWNELTINPIKDENGKVIQFVGIQNDITQRRILESQLRQAQKMEAIGSLAGGIAHDFNNLLAVIGINVERLLLKADLSAEIREGLEEALSAQVRGAALTRQLLSFSRRQSIKPKPVDIDQTLKGLLTMLERLINENIELKVDFGPEKKIVLGDIGQIEQIVVNLLINSRDAIDGKNAGFIKITTLHENLNEPRAFGLYMVPAGSYVQLSIEDNGCGISKGNLSRIFEPFFTTKEVGKGTGLGLATVYSIVRNAGGYINVSSQVGLGTQFKILLPSAKDDQNAGLKIEEPKNQSSNNNGKTILLAEDDSALRTALGRTLRDAGFSVLEASDGEVAFDLFMKNMDNIQLIITDVVMPKMGGRELAAKVSEICNHSKKVIFLSGYTTDTLLRHEISGIATNFLDKPFSIAKFLEKVSEVLASESVRV